MLNRLLWAIVFLLFFYGTWNGLHKGGEDFRVFHHAASLVLRGAGSEIYTNSPDRFLYAPGTAWLLTPLALLTWQKSYLVWTAVKFLALLGILNVLTRRFGETVAYLSVICLARPFLIEIRYGQVNLFLLFACLRALDLWCRDDRPSVVRQSVGWFFAGLSAGMKLFPGAVLLVPFLAMFRAHRRRAVIACVSAAFAGLLLILIPATTEGLGHILPSHVAWIEALRAKGMPTETHNQSITAFLLHAFSGAPTYSLTLGDRQTGTVFGWDVLPAAVLLKVGAGIGLAIIVGLFTLAHRISRSRSFHAVPFLIAGLVLPSHLIWKPYFVLGIPLVAQLLFLSSRAKYRVAIQVTTAVLVIVLNSASLDVIGPVGVAYFEAYAGFLWVYLALAGLCLLAMRRNPDLLPT